MSKITAKNLLDAKEAKNTFNKLIKPINDRCAYVVETICNIYGKRLKYWVLGNEGTQDGGEFDFSWKEFVQVYIYIDNGYDMICDLKDIEGINFCNEGFPMRFLYEDFEEEVKSGREKAKARIEIEKIEKKEKAKAAKVKKDALAASAKEKMKLALTPEEWKALKGKL